MKIIVRAPAKTYDGYCLAECMRVLSNVRDEPVIEVRALSGTPWSDVSHGGYCLTNTKKFLPSQLIVERIE